jgi:hypothetical protein
VKEKREIDQRGWFIMQHILLMIDRFGPSVFKQSQQILTFAMLMCEQVDDEETVILALQLLNVLVSSSSIKTKKKGSCLQLEDLEAIRQMIDSWEDCKNEDIQRHLSDLKTVLMIVHQNMTSLADTHDDSSSSSTEKTSETTSSFSQAMIELQDPFIPVRGHALMVLHNLITKNDPTTLQHIDTIFQLWVHSITDEDT